MHVAGYFEALPPPPHGGATMGYSSLKSYIGTDDIAAYLRIIAGNNTSGYPEVCSDVISTHVRF